MLRDEIAAARRRVNRQQPEGRYPLVFSNAHIRRVADGASLLILTRELTPDTYEIHNALTIRKNREHSQNRRPDLQESSLAFTIEILTIEQRTFADLDLLAARAAGFRTTDELRDDWRAQRGEPDEALPLQLHTFEIVTARYLHKLVHRGYTTDPAHAAEDEPQALGVDELEELSEAARERYRTLHAQEIAKKEARSLNNQLREAQSRALLRGVDITPEIAVIKQQIDKLRAKTERAA